MELLFNSASIASFNHRLEYLGENFNYRNTQDISIQGELLENAFSGISGIWNQISGVINDSNDFSEILINGISFGSGILRSLSFDSNNDVRSKKYSAKIDVYSTGNFSNMTGSYYSGLSGLSNYRLDLIDSLSESFDFTKNDDLTYNYDRNLDLKVIGTSGAQIAKDVASFIYNQPFLLPFVNAFYPNFYIESGRKYRRELFDLEQGQFSFGESFRFQGDDPYIWLYTHNISFNEKDTSVTEDGNFRLVDLSDPSTLNSLFFSGLSGAYSRCSGLYSVYATTGCGLINSPVSQRINKNSFIGSFDYSISYSDNKNNLTGCFWTSTTNFQKQQGVYIISENGTIQGQGTKTYNPNNQYLSALSCYSGIESGVYSRLSGEFFATGFLENCQSGLFLTESSFTDSEYEGNIEYNFNYSTNQNYNTSGGIDYKELVISDDKPTPLFAIHGILNDKQIIAPVYSGNSTLGNYSNNITLYGSGDEFSLLNFMNTSTGMITLPSGDDIFINNLEYNFDPKAHKFNMRVDYNYTNYRSLLDVLV